MQKIITGVEEAITVMETVKKMPDYNVLLTIEMALQTSKLRELYSDPRLDDFLLKNFD